MRTLLIDTRDERYFILTFVESGNKMKISKKNNTVESIKSSFKTDGYQILVARSVDEL